MTTTEPPLCIKCKHRRPALRGFICKAFPKKIPDEIMFGGFDHTKPYPGDNGIRFEPIFQKKEREASCKVIQLSKY